MGTRVGLDSPTREDRCAFRSAALAWYKEAMAATSTMVPLGTVAPDFDLVDVLTNDRVRLDDLAGSRVLLVEFICRHCPCVRHIAGELGALSRDYAASGDVAIVAISSNDAVAYPADAPESLAEFGRKIGLTHPLLYDETQAVARAYGAVCTPDFFVFDERRRLVYRGQLDDSRPGNGQPVTGRDIRGALDAALTGRELSPDQRPSMGCSIKWKE